MENGLISIRVGLRKDSPDLAKPDIIFEVDVERG
jgi:hypothetical protein